MKWLMICAAGVASGALVTSACSKSQESECLAAWCGNPTEPASTDSNGWEPTTSGPDGAIRFRDANTRSDASVDTPWPGCPIYESYSTGNLKCDSCTERQCCPESTSCFSDDNCKTVAGCIEGCPNGNAKCEDDCRTKLEPAKVSKLDAFAQCEADKCSKDCW